MRFLLSKRDSFGTIFYFYTFLFHYWNLFEYFKFKFSLLKANNLLFFRTRLTDHGQVEANVQRHPRDAILIPTEECKLACNDLIRVSLVGAPGDNQHQIPGIFLLGIHCGWNSCLSMRDTIFWLGGGGCACIEIPKLSSWIRERTRTPNERIISYELIRGILLV